MLINQYYSCVCCVCLQCSVCQTAYNIYVCHDIQLLSLAGHNLFLCMWDVVKSVNCKNTHCIQKKHIYVYTDVHTCATYSRLFAVYCECPHYVLFLQEFKNSRNILCTAHMYVCVCITRLNLRTCEDVYACMCTPIRKLGSHRVPNALHL